MWPKRANSWNFEELSRTYDGYQAGVLEFEPDVYVRSVSSWTRFMAADYMGKYLPTPLLACLGLRSRTELACDVAVALHIP